MNTSTDKFSQLRKGLLELAVLRVVSANKVYAANILTTLADTEFSTAEGTLYPLLSRLRRDNLVAYEWVESESGPPRKYYRLTPAGQAYMHEIEAYWQALNKTITTLGAHHE